MPQHEIETTIAETVKPEYVPIKVTAGILIHIGAGIYNSVAGAIKELVSNSFDADATQVLITTDYPRFQEIKVVDDGLGMTDDRFREAMRSIGTSLKGTVEPRRSSTKFKRPVIGHLGIGLMALSQVCAKAEIESQAEGSTSKFLAILDFSQFQKRESEQKEAATFNIYEKDPERSAQRAVELKNIMRDRSTDRATKAMLRKLRKEAERQEKEHWGYCILYPDLPAIPGQQGTVITLRGIKEGIQKLLIDDGRPLNTIPKPYLNKGFAWEEYRDAVNALPWEEICERLRTGAGRFTYQSLPMYHQFLWELSVMTPVQYLPTGPVEIKRSILEEDRGKIKKFDFSLRVDNRPLYKPILLPSGALAKDANQLQERYDYYIETIDFDRTVDEDRLKYHGYIFWQRKQVAPTAIRGIEIYIRNVGIGLYDYTLMNYGIRNPAHRAGQVSGEIYVDAGLERALNVDRNSFRETDAHYLAMQEHLWKLLGSGARKDGIFGMSVDSYYIRKERDEEEGQGGHVSQLRKHIDSISNGRVSLSFSERKEAEPYIVEGNRIIVYNQSPRWPRSTAQRHLAQTILLTIRAEIMKGATPQQILKAAEKILLKESKRR